MTAKDEKIQDIEKILSKTDLPTLIRRSLEDKRDKLLNDKIVEK